MNIDIERLENIREELEELEGEDAIFVDEDGDTRFVILPASVFETVEHFMEMVANPSKLTPSISIVGGKGLELSYDEYEQVKEQILKALDETLKPKPDKLS